MLKTKLRLFYIEPKSTRKWVGL